MNKLLENLKWTMWQSLDDKTALSKCSKEPGIYRIRIKNQNIVVYIGETGRDLRERLQDLSRNYLKEKMPFNDPHTAAPSLWAWKDARGYNYEWSVAPTSCNTYARKSLESLLLYNHRLNHSESTLCNFGRFHKNYSKSTSRKQGIQGQKLSEGTNPAGGISSPPLQLSSKYSSVIWMGLDWSRFLPLTKENITDIPSGPGLYRIADEDINKLMYIGQSTNIKNRLRDHIKRYSNHKFSYVKIINYAEQYQLRERENDLIAAYIFETDRPPIYQFGNRR